MDELNSEQTQTPGKIIEKPMILMVLGVLGIMIGCYRFFRLSLSVYKMIAEVQKNTDNTARIIYMLIWLAGSVGFLIWLFIVAIGLIKMKKWARNGAIIYALVQIGIFVTAGIYTSIVVLLNLVNPHSHRLIFKINYMRMVVIALIYPILLLIFMSTQKVKRAFTGIVG
jgi:uncharacterized protein YhhL (DUF1145 family)